jgi:hypothetical protein
MRTIERSHGTPDDPITCCATVFIEYPEITNAPSDTARDSLNAAISGQLLSTYEADSSITEVAQIAERFIEEFSELLSETASASLPEWETRHDVSVMLNDYGVLTLEFFWQAYTGGAHPNSTTHFVNYDIAAGQQLTLQDILIDDYEVSLTDRATDIFREARGLSDDISLTEAGFWFEDGLFSLTDNFAIGLEGLTFYYNPYDIAPYAMGPTEFTLPYELITDLIRMPGPIDPLID